MICIHWWQVQQGTHGLDGCVLCCSLNDSYGLICTLSSSSRLDESPGLICALSSFSRLDCDRVVRPRPLSIKLSIALRRSRNRWRHLMPFVTVDFRADCLFLHPSVADPTCVFNVNILSMWIPRYLMLFVRSTFLVEGNCWLYLS